MLNFKRKTKNSGNEELEGRYVFYFLSLVEAMGFCFILQPSFLFFLQLLIPRVFLFICFFIVV